MRNRTLLSILIAMALLYYGFPQLPISGGQLEFAFSVGWIVFAIMVIGGNLAEYLYLPAKKKETKKQAPKTIRRERERMF